MDLEALLKQYDDTFKLYQDKNKAYLDYINNPANTEAVIKKDLISIPNYEYIGSGLDLEETHMSTIDLCKASCSATTTCKGATFSKPKTETDLNCALKTVSSGDGLIQSKTDSYAIINKRLQFLIDLKVLNNQLTTINNSIINYIDTNKNTMSAKLSDNQNTLSNLSDNLNYLVDNKDEIDDKIKSIQEIDSKIDESSKIVIMNHSFFGVLSFVALLVFIIFLFIFSNSIDNSNNNSNLGNGLSFQESIDNGSIYYNMIFLVVLFICSFLVWVNKTTVDNWFKKYFYNSSYLI
jgi:hypothetical protein